MCMIQCWDCSCEYFASPPIASSFGTSIIWSFYCSNVSDSGAYLFSAIFICLEYLRLGVTYRRQHRVLFVSFWIKFLFIVIELGLAIGFGVLNTKDRGASNAAAILEWGMSNQISNKETTRTNSGYSHRVGLYILRSLIHHRSATIRTHAPPCSSGRKGTSHEPVKYQLWTTKRGHIRRTRNHRLHGRPRKHLSWPSGQWTHDEWRVSASRLLIN
jgi:hypothetical protein